MNNYLILISSKEDLHYCTNDVLYELLKINLENNIGKINVDNNEYCIEITCDKYNISIVDNCSINENYFADKNFDKVFVLSNYKSISKNNGD